MGQHVGALPTTAANIHGTCPPAITTTGQLQKKWYLANRWQKQKTVIKKEKKKPKRQ